MIFEPVAEKAIPPYPSVTQVLGVYTDYSTIPGSVLSHAADRGTRVHAACAAVAKGLWPRTDAETKGYVASFSRWLKGYVAEVISVEERIVDEILGYSGQYDLIVRMVGDDCLTVIDLKTPQAETPTWKGQLAAYRELAHSKYPLVQRTIALKLDSDGGKPKLIEYKQDYRDFAAFLAALTAYRYFKGEETK